MSKKKVDRFVIYLDEVLGTGTFGTVYLGIDTQTNDKVAIKALNKRSKIVDMDKYMKQSMKLEIKILHKIKSQHIVKFIDVIQTHHNYYIVQEFCQGGDLSKFLKKKGCLPQEEAIEMLSQILCGFYDIIRHGIVHRDMKPQNILINKNQVKIADFGLARPSNENVHLMSSVGTPMYQSPQMLEGQKYNYKCDIWAIGLIYYEMLFGKLPWNFKKGLIGYFESIKTNKIEFPTVISKESSIFIKNCLLYNEDQRADWQYMFSAAIFAGKVPKYDILKQKFAYILNSIRRTIHENNLDLSRFFQSQKLNSSSNLNRKDFSRLLKNIAPKLQLSQIQYVISCFDQDGNGVISFSEFEKTLEQYDIRRQSYNQKQIKKLLSVYIDDDIDKKQIQRQEKYINISEKLVQSIKKKQVFDIYSLFIKHDVSRQGLLTSKIFNQLLLTLNQTLTQDECNFLFDQFDQNKDQKISFQEFFKNICKMTGSLNTMN